MARFIPAVIDQHAEEAAFLWLLRDRAVGEPHYSLADLAELDGRVEAHLDGLRVAGDAGWRTCRMMLEEGEAGEVFAAAVLACESGLPERIQGVLELAAAQPERLRGLVSALGWLDWPRVEMLVRQMASKSQPPLWRRTGIAAAALHRQNLGGVLEDALLAAEPGVKARALEAVGELGLAAHSPLVRRSLTSADHAIRFASAWSAALLRPDAEAAAILRAFVESKSPLGDQAVPLAARRLEPGQAQRWRDKLLIEPHRCRRAVQAAGAVGDPEAVPFLLDAMNSPALARLAGEAFSFITGADLADEGLEGEPPDGFEAGPSEDADDEDVALDPDENLPWPNRPAIDRWWQPRSATFARGTRYLLGQSITPNWLRTVLRQGKQRQRSAAALELALAQAGQPLFETRAPGWRQRRMVAS